MKLIALLIIIAFVITSCASLPGVRGDNFANDAPTQNMVVKKAESDHWWDMTKILFGTTIGVIGQAILLNNFW
uniref:Lipoprotein n=1 Tax=viral metagenome TaxID=1070528 RepID=A0A6M3KID3_9ZZZZ